MQPPSYSSFQTRASGILLHPTSLPGPYGCGDLGPSAFRFIDFLAQAGQSWWQMLPIGPPGRPPGYSPYSSYSAFAGDASLISLQRLHEEDLLTEKESRPVAGLDSPRIRFGRVWSYRQPRLRLAFARFKSRSHHDADFASFCQQQSAWLDDYALFRALHRAHHAADWGTWPKALRLRQPAALAQARQTYADEIAFEQFVQYQFHRQWTALHTYARQKSVGLIGDIPIFVAYDSSEVWAHRHLFLLASDGRPSLVSGCPPDPFARDGQRWNHPHYRWKTHAASNFAWWVARFKAIMDRFDAVRIDHFLGFDRFWAIPAAAKTARTGKWMRGPGRALFDAVREQLPTAAIIAEDLGLLTPNAARMRDELGFPGMRVLQFGFGPGGDYHLPHRHTPNSVAYTGTHDNNTAVGWFQSLNGQMKKPHPAHAKERAKVLRYLQSDGSDVHWHMIRAALSSVARTTIFPMQDILGLDADARMNVPGTSAGNWNWRLDEKSLTPDVASRLAELTQLYDRTPITV